MHAKVYRSINNNSNNKSGNEQICQGDIPEYLIKINKIQSFIIQSRQGAGKFLAGGTKFKKGYFF